MSATLDRTEHMNRWRATATLAAAVLERPGVALTDVERSLVAALLREAEPPGAAEYGYQRGKAAPPAAAAPLPPVEETFEIAEAKPCPACGATDGKDCAAPDCPN